VPAYFDVEFFVAELLFFDFFAFLFFLVVLVLLLDCCPANVSGVIAAAKPIAKPSASNVFFIGFRFSLSAGFVCLLTVS
jgi:hypothetical protein